MKQEARSRKQETRNKKQERSCFLPRASCLVLLALCFMLFPSAYAEDPGFRSKVVYRKVSLDKDAIETIGIKTEKIIKITIDEVIKTTGQIEEIPKNHFDVNSPVQGVITSVLVDLGDFVQAAQPLAIIKSTEITKLQAEAGQFKAELELAKSYYEREKSLFEHGISAKKEFQASEANLKSTEAKSKAAENNLKILTGLSDNTEAGEFTVRAKKSGTITERNIAIGQTVSPNQILFRGVDLSTVWANADIYEKDIAKVTLGQTVRVTLDGQGEKIFEGMLTYIGSVLSKEARTLPVKATLNNIDGLLKPGTFIQLLISTNQKKNSIVISRTALVETDKEGTEGKHAHLVYVQKGKSFIPKKIEVESHDSNTVEVLSGLMDGEIIVTQGSYQLQYAHGDKITKHNKSFVSFHLTPLQIIFLIILSLLTVFFITLKLVLSKKNKK